MNTNPEEMPSNLHNASEGASTMLVELRLHQFVRHMWPQMDPAPFVDGWHIRVICGRLEAVCRGEIKRLIINIPPRHCKSLLISVWKTAYPLKVLSQKDSYALKNPKKNQKR